MRARLAQQGGFTLIELLVVLILMGTIGGALTTSFASAFAGETRAVARATNEENARLSLARLRLDLHCSSGVIGPGNNTLGGSVIVLHEQVATTGSTDAACTSIKLGILSDGSSSLAVSWCTVFVSANRWRLYREKLSDCDGVGSTFMVDYIVQPDIWTATATCTPGWQSSVGVNLTVNLTPQTPVNQYKLLDTIGLRNTGRHDADAATPTTCK
jgi:prepilin-type N-terminal cleavage/methylation domain-containing protein